MNQKKKKTEHENNIKQENLKKGKELELMMNQYNGQYKLKSRKMYKMKVKIISL